MADANAPKTTPPLPYEILHLFEYSHLPDGELRELSSKFYRLAWHMAENLPHSAETSAGLRKLREAKDCAVGAMIIERKR